MLRFVDDDKIRINLKQGNKYFHLDVHVGQNVSTIQEASHFGYSDLTVFAMDAENNTELQV